MTRKNVWFGVLTLGAMLTSVAGAQQPPGSKTGNPTPGTPQPDPPNLADRITVAGCLQAVPPAAGQKDADPNEPSDARFLLDKPERKNVVPPGTGTSSLAAAPAAASYRLKAIASQLMPFVGTRVEISGEVVPSAPKAGEANPLPTLQVEFVQKLAANCR